MREAVPARWAAAILVCGKCEKKLGGGFGADGRERLSKLLRKRAGGGKGRKAAIGVIETRCLKLCPRRAVTVVNGARPGEWLVVAAGTPIEAVEVRLRLGARPAESGAATRLPGGADAPAAP